MEKTTASGDGERVSVESCEEEEQWTNHVVSKLWRRKNRSDLTGEQIVVIAADVVTMSSSCSLAASF
jgi:hypothetical protein